jgi:hypothetical protein
MSVVFARRLPWSQIASKTTKASRPAINRVGKRFFEAPQEDDTITEIQPFLGTGQYWNDTAAQIKFRMSEEAEFLSDEDAAMLQQSIRVAEYMAEKQKNVTIYPYKTREEAGNDDEVASIYGNVGHKMGQELYYRVREGFDTEQEFYGESALYGPFGTEEDPVLVPSMGKNRFVACQGGHDGFVEHELAWFVVKQGPKHRCPICGQIFKLHTTDTSHPDHPYHDPKRDYRGEMIMTLINDP